MDFLRIISISKIFLYDLFSSGIWNDDDDMEI